MLDAEHSGSSSSVSDSSAGSAGSERRQYTLKGIEADAIRLMRAAADKDGMKIGTWVSARIKEAAALSLTEEQVQGRRRLAGRSHSSERDRLSAPLSKDVCFSDDRLAALEAELKDIAAAQRAIMTFLLQERTCCSSKSA